MAQEVCIRCQAPVVLGQDLCATCGAAISNFAVTERGLLNAALAGGTRRRPGEYSTFVRLRWLAGAFGIAMGVATYLMLGGVPGLAAGISIGLLSGLICVLVQRRFRRIADGERGDTDRHPRQSVQP